MILRPLYDWVMAQSAKPRAMVVLAAVAFAEASFFPVPHVPLMVPMILAKREAAWRIAAWATFWSILGGMFGYAIGFYLFESIGGPMLNAIGKADALEKFGLWYEEFGLWVVLAGGFTPLPYKVVTILSGWQQLPFMTFLIGSIVSRGALMFLVAGIFYWGGPKMKELIERYLGLATILALLLLGGLVYLLKVM